MALLVFPDAGETSGEKWATTCTDNWTVAKSVEENQIQVFKQTGIFVMACCHGFVECIVEMKQSGELMKYGLVAVNQLLNVCGQGQAVGHDIGCASKKTISASSLGAKAQEKQLKVVVNTFHGFAHNCMCQLQNHPLYQLGFGNKALQAFHNFSSQNMLKILKKEILFYFSCFQRKKVNIM
ncbi:hypothetical protein EDC04DRAFT_2587023 [Pisolithus marmoratus]|nr:hypothetical protein EDC04DRAFT_2587023 [Pisolithus marmoratus]